MKDAATYLPPPLGEGWGGGQPGRLACLPQPNLPPKAGRGKSIVFSGSSPMNMCASSYKDSSKQVDLFSLDCSGQVISDSLIGLSDVDSGSKAFGDRFPSFECSLTAL